MARGADPSGIGGQHGRPRAPRPSRFRVLMPDRPGTLGTAIENGRTPEQQADLEAALLDTLGIVRVSVVGISAEGPAAIQFPVRHASRTNALMLLSAISQRAPLCEEGIKPYNT